MYLDGKMMYMMNGTMLDFVNCLLNISSSCHFSHRAIKISWDDLSNQYLLQFFDRTMPHFHGNMLFYDLESLLMQSQPDSDVTYTYFAWK